MIVYVCSNRECDAVWAADPHGHCPKCLNKKTGVGWSTMHRQVSQLPDSAQRIDALERLLGYAVTSERTGFSKPPDWLQDAQRALGYDYVVTVGEKHE